MPTLTIEYQTEADRLVLEQAIAFFSQIKQVAATAPDGTVLAACEQVALTDGRQFVRDSLAHAVQTRVDATPNKLAHAPRGDTNAGS